MSDPSRKRIERFRNARCIVLIFLGMAVLGGTFEGAAQISTPTAQDVQTHTTAKPETLGQAKPLRATTRMVELSVIVRDKNDQLVRDLTKSDFEVLDNGARQDIQIFSVTTNEPLSRLPTALSPNTYTNRTPGIGDAPSNITVLLLDSLNTPFSDQAFANQRIVKFLEALQPRDRIAIYSLTGRLRMLHDFTSDASSLTAALKGYKGQLSELDDAQVPDLGYTGNPMAALLGRDLSQEEAERNLSNRIELTLQAMTEIAKHLAPLPGRKNLIWVSGSFPLSSAYIQMNAAHGQVVFAKQLATAAEALANDALVIYPVDARGLITTTGEDFKPPDAFEFMTMKGLAAETGGVAFFNTNDIGGAVRAALDDSRIAYEIGYYPAIGKWDGSFRKLKVKVDVPGAHVRTRSGYLAIPEPGLRPLETGAIDLTVRVENPTAEKDDLRALHMDVLIDPRQLNLKSEDGRWKGVVNLVFIQSDNNDRILDTLQQPYQMMLLPETYEQPPAEGFKFTQTLRIVPRAEELRVVVRDASSGLAGSVDVPLLKYFPMKSNSND
jgi:VWFA-related protein